MSRDIGPALPPHMRSFDEERSGDEQDRRRRKNRDKYSERERERDRDRERERRSDRERDRDRSRRDDFRDRPSRHTSERDRKMPREHEVERDQRKKDKVELERSKVEASSSKRSKRSKTDRTYNTDTEESSDDDASYTNLEWIRGKKSNLSDSEEEVPSKKEESECEESYVIGPALPPSFSNRSNCELSSRSEKNVFATSAHANETNVPHRSLEKEALLSCSDEEAEVSCTDATDIVGPALPPSLIKSDHRKGKSSIGPELPPSLRDKTSQIEEENVSIGPALPPHLKTNFSRDKEQSDSIGPALPHHLISKGSSSSSIIGPAIPAHLKTGGDELDEDSTEIGPILPPKSSRSLAVGPSLPPGMDIQKYSGEASEASSDDEVVGPLLPGEMIRSEKNYVVQAQLERNAAAIKRKLEEKDLPGSAATRREDWMLELPPEGTVDLGLGPRTFRARGAPEKGADRSMWTDTPADKARKEEEAKRRFELGITSTEEVKKEALSKNMSNKDRSMEAIVKKHKRSKESLLDAHQKKLEKEKKKKEKAGVKQERRPFNRETDLKTNVFDDAQKKAIYKKAQFLDNRFSSGESKFL